ncbi:hypothetical protein LOK49_LG11G01528 [Camellia lanceoleosa]|uniref:Uncharacterized protein n=1 Tax=Camellia lanceoleosa TaxID=1840588 RepID=A0ACC0G2W1_9ERIC|nr:hypothetical protein LOK49_LG11G01528 [Camellia lanceoleosa]
MVLIPRVDYRMDRGLPHAEVWPTTLQRAGTQRGTLIHQYVREHQHHNSPFPSCTQ